jgi:hypothetical protein
MGSSVSVSTLAAEEISDKVSYFGNSYNIYKEGILSNDINGKYLETLRTEEQIDSLFEKLNINTKSHQIAFKKKILNIDFETRGVSIKLFQAVKREALFINPDEGYWSMGRISAELIGNHEILKPGNRWGNVDKYKTLTFNDDCSLIDLLQNRNRKNRHPYLKVRYDEVVGECATVFVSFAYADNFIELGILLLC